MKTRRGSPSSGLAAACCLLLFVPACARISGGRNGQPVSRDFYASSSAVCDLLSPRTLTGMLGYRYQDGIGGIYPDFLSFSGITTCIYLPVGNGPPVQTGIVYAYADQIYEEVRQIRLRARLTPLKRIAGLGERAFWDVGVRQLAVLKEDKIFVIHVSSGEFEPSSDTELRARRLAALALGKLR